MKKRILVLFLSVLVLIPSSSSSQGESTNVKAGVDRLYASHLKNRFRDAREDLSRIKKDLEAISTSITSHESTQSYLVKRSYEDIESVAGICLYLERGMDELLLVKEDKLSYYCYLKKYGIEKMQAQSNNYLKKITKRRAEISHEAALRLLGRATEDIRLSSGLMEDVVEMLQRCSQKEGAASHH